VLQHRFEDGEVLHRQTAVRIPRHDNTPPHR
jgi:hypothetical protein